MSVTRDLLSPEGRMSSGAFLKYALVLIAIQFVLALSPMLRIPPPTSWLFSVLSVALFYPWVVLWIKRLHDAGHKGWLLLIFVLIWIILTVIASLLVPMLLGVETPTMTPGADASAVFGAAMEQARRLALPNAVAGALVSLLTVFGANMMLPADAGPNEFGEPPAR